MAQTTRKIVRNGIAAYVGGTFDPATRSYRNGPLLSAGVSVVRAYRAKRTPDTDYLVSQAAGRGMGTYLTIELSEDDEIRRAMPAVTGRKRITYATVIHGWHLAYKAYAEDAEADIDDVVEAIKGLLHADPSLGGICYEAGENPTGIKTRIDHSEVLSEHTETHFSISFDTQVEIVA